MRPAWSLIVLLAAGCGRTHTLQDGEYQFTLGEVVRDDCGLTQEPGVLTTGILTTTGDVVRLDYGFDEIGLVGTYLASEEAMTLDGTAVNVSTNVRSQACLLDAVAIHIDAVTRSATHFNGVMSVSFDTRTPDSCVCQFWFKYDAQRTGRAP